MNFSVRFYLSRSQIVSQRSQRVCVAKRKNKMNISNERYSKLCLNRTKSGQGSRGGCVCVSFYLFQTERTNRVGFLIESTRRKIVTKAFSRIVSLVGWAGWLAAGLHGLY